MDAAATTLTFSSYYHLFFTALAFSISTLLFINSRTKQNVTGKKNKKSRPYLPPGPPGWPIVGNLFQVARSGKPFFQYVRDLLPQYGPIFTLRMGARTMIIVCNAELAHEALVQKGLAFSNRPRENPTRSIFSNNKFTVNAALYGPVWRSLRRNMVQNALSATRLREFRGLRDAAMDKLVNRLRAESEAEGAVWVLRNARFAVFCILLAMCFGLEMDEDTIDRIDQMMKKVLITLDPRIDDFLPILSVFFSKQRRHALEVRKEQIETLAPLIERRRAAVMKNPGSDPSAASFSYLDTLFDLEIEGRKAGLSHADIVSLISEFLNGGTDTTATAIEWGMARLIENPSIQEKLYCEIEATVGKGRKVDEADVERMPYLNAFTKELLRKHPPTYFALTHGVTEAATVGGYDVPAEASVEFFLPAISEDPTIWADPGRFDPERFLGGREEADITGVKAVKMLPFGAGRRICPGLVMATIHINLMVARMVQEFEWRAFPVGEKIDFSEKFEFTVVMKIPVRAAIKPRG